MKNRHSAAALFLLLLAGTVMAGCGDTAAQPVQADTQAAATETDTAAETGITDNLPALDYGGDTVSVYVFGLDLTANRDADGRGDGGDVLDTALYQRNLDTEERLNVKLSFVRGSDDWEGYPNQVKKMVAASDCPYDMIFMESSQCFRLSLDGYFRELTSLPYVDLDQPWWYTAFMDGGSIQTDKRYFLTGAFSISTLEGASCTIFNKTLFNRYFESADELYDLVEAHQWTYDRFREYCRAVYSDVNGDGTADEGDIYGFHNRGLETLNFSSMSIGYTFITRDEDGLPVLDIYNEQSVKWVEMMYSLLHDDNMCYTLTNSDDGLTLFAAGNALFFQGLLSEYIDETTRAMSDPYGVLPMPVMEEGLEYMSAGGTVNGESAVVPVTTEDSRLEECGAVLEALSVEAYRTMLPAWYDVALKSKYTDTERDADMIDIIYSTIDTSFIMMADKLIGTGSFFGYFLSSKKTAGEFASYYEKQEKGLQKKWDSMIESYLALGE